MMTVLIQHTSYLFHQRDTKMLSSISKKLGSWMTQIIPGWLSRNPLGTILNLLIIYSQWWVDIYARNKFIIDHYLGKDTVNNILATRFGNILLEPLWNREYIEEVQIFATETIGCDGRSQYYETCWCGQRHVTEPYHSGLVFDCVEHLVEWIERFVERKLKFFLR